MPARPGTAGGGGGGARGGAWGAGGGGVARVVGALGRPRRAVRGRPAQVGARGGRLRAIRRGGGRPVEPRPEPAGGGQGGGRPRARLRVAGARDRDQARRGGRRGPGAAPVLAGDRAGDEDEERRGHKGLCPRSPPEGRG